MRAFTPDDYNVHFFAYVSKEVSPGNWAWEPFHFAPEGDPGSPVARSFVYGCHEVRGTLRAASLAVARILGASRPVGGRPDRFCVTARCPVIDAVLGRDQWLWERGEYRPHGSPWCVASTVVRPYGVQWEHDRAA